MHNFETGLKFAKHVFKSNLYFVVFDGEASKEILFSNINRCLRLTTQGSIRTDLIKKLNIIIYPELNSVYPYTSPWYSHALPLNKLLIDKIIQLEYKISQQRWFQSSSSLDILIVNLPMEMWTAYGSALLKKAEKL